LEHSKLIQDNQNFRCKYSRICGSLSIISHVASVSTLRIMVKIYAHHSLVLIPVPFIHNQALFEQGHTTATLGLSVDKSTEL